ncbi:MAG: cation diffusion facilitator family transporter, partial [bacterium]
VFASPRHYMLLSTAAAIATIVLKTLAWRLTGSVGLLSDAMESGVNLVAAIGAFWALTLAAKPADRKHHYGHFKAEYFSSGLESVLIVVAALAIIHTAIGRLQD